MSRRGLNNNQNIHKNVHDLNIDKKNDKSHTLRALANLGDMGQREGAGKKGAGRCVE